VRCDSHAVTLFTTCFYGLSIEPDTFFSHVHAFQTCLFLVHCLSLQEHAADAGAQVQGECSRGGRKTG